jgi:hypothetical protein
MKLLNYIFFMLCSFLPTHLFAKDCSTLFNGRKITIQVPITAGGTYDLMARALMEPMSDFSGAKLSVENKSALDGWLALRAIAKSHDRDIHLGLFEVKKLLQVTQQRSLSWSDQWSPLYTFIRQDSVWLTRANNPVDIRATKSITFAGSFSDQIEAKALAKYLGKDLKLITSYSGINEFAAATLRREIDYFSPVLSTANRLLKSGDFRPALILGVAINDVYQDTPYLLGPGHILNDRDKKHHNFLYSEIAKKINRVAQSNRQIISASRLSPIVNQCLEKLIDQSIRSEKFLKKVDKFGFTLIHEGASQSRRQLASIQQDIIDLERFILND